MAPRANWKGYLRLSLVSCPILLYPATSESEKVHFNQINRATGHRIKMQKVDAATGDVVDADEIVKGYKAGDTSRSPMRTSRQSRWSRPGPSMSTSSFRVPRSTISTSTGPTNRAGRRGRPAGVQRHPRRDREKRHGGARPRRAVDP
jgi:hypothetical protein